ncbi:hypothetical protein BLNAU_10497 [Blattamonas nauphoetae]|uniref:HAT C-terminal dimerisation domain-containing protein n=1 Tax=Blattamonas nauphoetae TaxID=2049346 RepID=A0ABQ9XSV7_9EUKA|nr:hypothetical protein BLNAU_10497 [Blattamonas nauphoetae]
MFGLLKVMQTIFATTVDTEREFSTVHRTKGKDRTNLTTHHVEVLTKIYHNTPPLHSDDTFTFISMERDRIEF